GFLLGGRDARLLRRVVRRTGRGRAGAAQPGPYEPALLARAGGLVDVGDRPGEAAPEGGEVLQAVAGGLAVDRAEDGELGLRAVAGEDAVGHRLVEVGLPAGHLHQPGVAG